MCKGDAADTCTVSTALECARVCEVTSGCTGFMVQDNTPNGAPAKVNVCQIVSDQIPISPDSFGFPNWGSVAKWVQDDGMSSANPPTTLIGGHDVETRDRCYKRGSCSGLPACVVGAPDDAEYQTPPAPCCLVYGSRWGLTFLILFCSGSATYTLGGGLYAKRVLRKDGSLLTAHPHADRWIEFRSLCEDGVAFSRARMWRRNVTGAKHAGRTAAYGAVGDSGVTAGKQPQVGSYSTKREQKAKKNTQKTKGKRSQETPAAVFADSDLPGDVDGGAKEPAQTAPRSTPAGGSGRWVHIPT